MRAISVIGYSPDNLHYCPECGAQYFPHTIHGDGRMRCEDCGLVCYIVEADDSHREKDTDA